MTDISKKIRFINLLVCFLFCFFSKKLVMTRGSGEIVRYSVDCKWKTSTFYKLARHCFVFSISAKSWFWLVEAARLYAKRFILQMTDITHKKEEAPEVNTVFTQTKFYLFSKKTYFESQSGKKHGCKLWRITRLTIAICLITRLTTRKWPIIKVLLTRDSPRGWVTWVWSITFMTQLLLSLGRDLVLFASLTNVESGPRFAEVCTGVTYFPVCEKN